MRMYVTVVVVVVQLAVASERRAALRRAMARASFGVGWTLVYHAGAFKGRAELLRLLFEDAGVTYVELSEGLCVVVRELTSSEVARGCTARAHVGGNAGMAKMA